MSLHAFRGEEQLPLAPARTLLQAGSNRGPDPSLVGNSSKALRMCRFRALNSSTYSCKTFSVILAQAIPKALMAHSLLVTALLLGTPLSSNS